MSIKKHRKSPKRQRIFTHVPKKEVVHVPQVGESKEHRKLASV